MRGVLTGGEDPDPAGVAEAGTLPGNTVRRTIRGIEPIPAGLNRCLGHLKRRYRMAAPAAPVLAVKRIGDGMRQQLAPAFAQRHAVRRIGGKHRFGKVIFMD